jgi:HSP20 family molecular chaperone IbpA
MTNRFYVESAASLETMRRSTATSTSQTSRPYFTVPSRLDGPPPTAQLAEGTWIPTADVYEDDHDLVIDVEVPGIGPDGIRLEVTNVSGADCSTSVLMLSGVITSRLGSRRTLLAERSDGAFGRVFVLPPGYRADDTKATIEDGLLSLRVPFTPEEGGPLRSTSVIAIARPAIAGGGEARTRRRG